MSKKRIGVALATVCAAYLVWPYLTLYRLADAIRQGDAATLESLVDWEGVREGIKEDICDNLFDEPATAQTASVVAPAPGEHLPPFGFSFVKGIAANAVDANINPQALVSAARDPRMPDSRLADAQPASRDEVNPSVAWAFFEGLTNFSVELRPPGAAAGDEPIRIVMELRHGAWKVTRAWLPRAMLTQANART